MSVIGNNRFPFWDILDRLFSDVVIGYCVQCTLLCVYILIYVCACVRVRVYMCVYVRLKRENSYLKYTLNMSYRTYMICIWGGCDSVCTTCAKYTHTRESHVTVYTSRDTPSRTIRMSHDH